MFKFIRKKTFVAMSRPVIYDSFDHNSYKEDDTSFTDIANYKKPLNFNVRSSYSNLMSFQLSDACIKTDINFNSISVKERNI